MRAFVVVVFAWGLGPGCKSCIGDPPNPPRDTDVDSDEPDTEPPDVETADTAPVDPCLWRETEPNGVTEPDLLELEQLACGEFATPGDADNWRFTLPEASWISVRVDARALNSRADPLLGLSSDSGTNVIMVDRYDGHEDILTVFPAVQGTWTALLNEQLINGGPDEFYYQMLVGSAKVPVEWDMLEVEPNAELDDANPMGSSEVVYGVIGERFDVDSYSLRVGPGKRKVTFDIDAGEHGSPGNYAFTLFDDSGVQLADDTTGEQSDDKDPFHEYVSMGNEDLVIRVREQLGEYGTPYWYLLTITQEIDE